MFLNQILFKKLSIISALVFIAACSNATDNNIAGHGANQFSEQSVLTVFKPRTCQCCLKWVEHINEHGFTTKIYDQNNLSKVKEEKGLKPEHQSCHTSVSKEGYIFEGHIPAKFVRQFLQEKPAGARGITVPAMPVGSPGMEVGNKFSPYEVLLLKTDGTVEIYAKVNTKEDEY